MFWPLTDQHSYTTTTHLHPNFVLFGLPNNHRHFFIYWFRPVSTNYHFASSDTPPLNLRRCLNRIDLHIRITVTKSIGVVIPSSVGQSASSTRWCLTHKILTYSLRSIYVNLRTVISTHRPSYQCSDPDILRTTSILAPHLIPLRWPTYVSNRTKDIFASVLMKTTQDIDIVRSQSAFTEGLAAVQEWKTEHS